MGQSRHDERHEDVERGANPERRQNPDRHIALQEQRTKEATLAGRNTAQDGFELQKLQLLIAILREGRERLLERQARGGSVPRNEPARPEAG